MNLTAIIAIFLNDLRLLSRDRARIVLTLGWPLAIAVFFGALTPSRDKLGTTVAIAQSTEDSDSYATRFAHELNQVPQFRGVVLPQAEALRQLAAQDIAAVVASPSLPGRELVVETGKISANETRLLDLALTIAALRVDSSEQNPAIVHIASQNATVSIPANGHDATFPQGMMWAVLSLAAKFGGDFSQEERQKTLFRLRVSPLSSFSIVVAKSLACWITMVALQLFVLAIGLVFFHVSLNSVALLLLAVTSTATFFTGAMMAIAVWGRRSSSAGNLTWALFMTLAMIGGGMVPAHVMPPWMRLLAASSPVYWSLQSIEAGLWNQHAAENWIALHSALLGLGVILLAWGARKLSRSTS